MNFDEVQYNFLQFYSINLNFRGSIFDFPHPKKIFFCDFFYLIPVKTFKWDHKLSILDTFGILKKSNKTPINSVCKGGQG